MTIQQLAKQLDIPVKQLERESIRAFLLTKLGEIEAKRQKIVSTYTVKDADDWDKQLIAGDKKEGSHQELSDYFFLDVLDGQKEKIISLLSARS